MNVFSYTPLQSLYETARQVLESKAPPEMLRKPLDELKRMVEFRESQVGEELLDRARECYSSCSDDIELDDKPIIDPNSAGGYWIMAWCYIEEAEQDEDESSPHVVGAQ